MAVILSSQSVGGSSRQRLVQFTFTLSGGVWSKTSGPTVVHEPPSGRSAMWCSVAPTGDVLWYDLPEGYTPNLNFDQTTLIVNGVTVAKPGGWWAQGHAEWSPDADHIVQAVSPGPAQAFRTLITPPDQSTSTQIGPVGMYDPSWPVYGNQIVAVDPVGTDVVRYNVNGLTVRHGPYRDVGMCYDPYLSPNGSQLVWLRYHTDGWSLRYRRLGKSTRTILPGSGATWINSNAHWLDDNHVILSRISDPFGGWSLWSCRVSDGALQQLTTPAVDGSLTFHTRVPDGVTL